MEQNQPPFWNAFSVALAAACREQRIHPHEAERYQKCALHYLIWLKKDGDWVKPSSVSREAVAGYLDHLRDVLRLDLSRQLFAFDVLQLIYRLVIASNLVLNAEDELIERLFDKVDRLGHSIKTAKTYSHYILEFFRFCKLPPWRTTHREFLTREHIETWLTYLAVERDVAETTQNGAMHAILYLAKNLFGIDVKGINAKRAKRPETLPEVLSQQQVATVLHALSGDSLILSLLGYGCGMRVSEACSLRVKDINFDRRQIIIRCAKGKVDRVVPLPQMLIPLLQEQIERSRKVFERDKRLGQLRIPLPNAFARKSPSAEQQFCWMWVFPSYKLSEDPKTKRIGRWHVNESNANRVVGDAAKRLNLDFRMHFHVWRHCYATHFLDVGGNIRKLQQLMGHKSIETTMRYLHVSLSGPGAELSPLDMLQQFVLPAKPVDRARRAESVRFPQRQHAG